MGYDMSVVDENGDSVHDCDEHETHYWRRSIFGGAPQAERFIEVGMGYYVERTGKWPEEPKGADWVEDEESGEQVPVNELAQQYQADCFAFLKATYSEQPGIAVYKLCDSNDGWWVTKAECESALKIWEAAGKPDVDKFGEREAYNDTIPFLRAAADHEGFRVW